MLLLVSEIVLYIFFLISTILLLIFWLPIYKKHAKPEKTVLKNEIIMNTNEQYIPSSLIHIYKSSGFQKVNPFGMSVYNWGSMYKRRQSDINEIYLKQETI